MPIEEKIPLDLLATINSLLQNQQYPLAETYIEQFLKENPTHLQLWLTLVKLQEQLNLSTKAIQTYQHALKLEPNYGPLWHDLAFLLFQTGQTQSALDCFKKAYQLDSNNSIITHSLAQALHRTHHLDESLNYYLQTLKLKPEDSVTLFNLGRLYQDKKNYLDAEQVLKQAIKQDQQALFYTGLASLYHVQRKLQQAEDACHISLQLNSDYPETIVRTFFENQQLKHLKASVYLNSF